jgi:hypothetical protein
VIIYTEYTGILVEIKGFSEVQYEETI